MFGDQELWQECYRQKGGKGGGNVLEVDGVGGAGRCYSDPLSSSSVTSKNSLLFQPM